MQDDQDGERDRRQAAIDRDRNGGDHRGVHRRHEEQRDQDEGRGIEVRAS